MNQGRLEVLDHGYVRLIETWGSDERIVEAARMSTGKGFLGWGYDLCALCGYKNDINADHCSGCGRANTLEKKPGDEKLLKYLYENKHDTPFEMAGMIIEVQAPIFVFREWHRHRTQSYNEMSARYTPLPDVNYMPTIERLMVNANGTNKQAGTVPGANVLTELGAEGFQRQLARQYSLAEENYQAALTCGVPKELARVGLPVGRYSRMRASTNLRNWLGFLTLRSAEGAQWEIRQYAHAVSTFIIDAFPRTWELYAKGRR